MMIIIVLLVVFCAIQMHLYPVLFMCLHGHPMDSDEDNVGLHCVLWRFSSRYFYRGVDDYHNNKKTKHFPEVQGNPVVNWFYFQ